MFGDTVFDPNSYMGGVIVMVALLTLIGSTACGELVAALLGRTDTVGRLGVISIAASLIGTVVGVWYYLIVMIGLVAWMAICRTISNKVENRPPRQNGSHYQAKRFGPQ